MHNREPLPLLLGRLEMAGNVGIEMAASSIFTGGLNQGLKRPGG